MWSGDMTITLKGMAAQGGHAGQKALATHHDPGDIDPCKDAGYLDS